jgi:hypothetical protein
MGVCFKGLSLLHVKGVGGSIPPGVLGKLIFIWRVAGVLEFWGRDGNCRKNIRHAGGKTVSIAPRLISRDGFRPFQLYLGGGLGVR